MKKLIAILLAAVLVCSALPSAFGVCSFGNTTEQYGSSKSPFHVGDDVTGYRQAVIGVLNDYWKPFDAKNDYYSGVREEAMGIYKAELARIYTLTDVDELVQPGIFGMVLNDETAAVCDNLEMLSQLDLTKMRNAAGYEVMRTKLLADIKENIEEEFSRADYNDYYWDMLQCDYAQAVEEINAAVTYLELIQAQYNWQNVFFETDFEAEELVEYEDYEDVFYYPQELLADVADALEEKLVALLEKYEKEGYRVETDAIDAVLEQYEDAAAQAPYVEKILKAYHNAEAAITAQLGITPESRKPLTVSLKRKALARLKALYLQYNEADYGESAWYDILDIYDEARSNIQDAKYADEADEVFFAEVAKELAAVKTLAQQLKEDKDAAIAALKKYVGNKKFNQTKIKALYAEGVKKIKAATTSAQVEKLCNQYVAAMNKAILTYKITVTKSGKGAVTKSATVKCGASYTVKIVPTAGYKIKSIVVDGKKVKLTNAYTFKNVTKAHSIKVTFSK
ncbi:MAG: hypothetical protein IJI67_07250 [Clostridia bacterium]|nr:hypothetical protein [Clostridia bacterium]